MPIAYDFDSAGRAYRDYYNDQHGNGLAVFRGVTTQRGHGIGGLLSGLLRGAAPLLKSGARTIGKELLTSGVGIASDLLSGDSFASSGKRRMSQAGRRLLDNLSSGVGVERRTFPESSRKRAPKRKSKGTKKSGKRGKRNILDEPFRS